MGALLSLGYIALLLYWIRRSRFYELPGLRKRHLAVLFLLKVAAGMGCKGSEESRYAVPCVR
jgi:hypothetical protein